MAIVNWVDQTLKAQQELIDFAKQYCDPPSMQPWQEELLKKLAANTGVPRDILRGGYGGPAVPFATTDWTQVELDLVKLTTTKVSAEILKELEVDILTGRVDPPRPSTGERYRVSVDLSLNELMHSQRHMDQLMQDMLHRMAGSLADKITLRLMSGEFDTLIESTMREEIRKQVVKSVAARVDDFIDEVI